MTRAAVVVAASFRPGPLRRCLDALRAQTLPADEVIVICHRSDAESMACASVYAWNWSALRREIVAEQGTVAAYNLGLAMATGEIVAFVDDDAVPATDWLQQIVTTFDSDPRIAAVGGRDALADERPTDLPGNRHLNVVSVGRIQWPGRMTANHHLGTGPARDVDVLKGVNMSFRRSEVIRHGFDERLRGEGAQVHAELTVCLPLRSRGLRVVYDPAILVEHHPAPRPYGNQRGTRRPEQVFVSAHNEALAILDYLPPTRRVIFTLWCIAIGNTESPGLAVFVRDLKRRRPAALARATAAQRGRLAAWHTRREPRRVRVGSPWQDGDRRQPGSGTGAPASS